MAEWPDKEREMESAPTVVPLLSARGARSTLTYTRLSVATWRAACARARSAAARVW